ncbi:MerR family transcriptional regulator [Nocardiopsis xinjiangensis]|uniref:MerR family transcriptional regulator n=1 Tax=Nocardiopsis xinjiangensis TaxID=124285 RepID=UPI00034B96D8|nr:MerR family transcriptional regulator [Nocardiopsis xinjiangensis]
MGSGADPGGPGGQAWKVGELARRTGLTVRTLHHYEQVGLVLPARRNGAGHRLYGTEEVERLYQVLALRELGLSLERIRGLLDAAPSTAGSLPPLGDLLAEQLAQVEHRLRVLHDLRGTLTALVATARTGPGLDAPALLELIEGMTTVNETFNAHFTPEQIAELERRRATHSDAVTDVIDAWPALLADVGSAVAAGTDPASAEAAELARRWAELLHGFHRGDADMRDSLYRMREEHAEEVQSHGGPSQEAIDFITRAQQAHS